MTNRLGEVDELLAGVGIVVAVEIEVEVVVLKEVFASFESNVGFRLEISPLLFETGRWLSVKNGRSLNKWFDTVRRKRVLFLLFMYRGE